MLSLAPWKTAAVCEPCGTMSVSVAFVVIGDAPTALLDVHFVSRSVVPLPLTAAPAEHTHAVPFHFKKSFVEHVVGGRQVTGTGWLAASPG
jgi:hypothetical protein